ncbi:MAG: hypothetical protein IPO16_00010 [Saprospiraceae bacterium]|nr:hypothetical protein [Saprospiraceae bacterium]
MKGVSYLTDESNEKLPFQIDLKEQKTLGRFCDYTIASKKKTGTIQRLAKGKADLKKGRN